MILRPFLSNQPLVALLLIPIVVGLQILNVFFPYHATQTVVDLGLWGNTTYLQGNAAAILAAVVVLLNTLQLNLLFNQHEFLERNNYGPSLFYVILMSFSHSFYQFDALLIVHACWLQVIRLLFLMHTNEDNRKQAFNAAFFVGTAATFLPASGALIFVLWLAVWAMKSFQFREWIMMILGFAFPVFNALMYWWFSGHTISLRLLRNPATVQHQEIVYYTTSIIVVFLFLLSIIGIQIRLQKSSIRFKKLNRSLVWILIGGVLLGSADLIFYQQLEWFNIIFVPLSFFFTFAFIHRFWQSVATIFFYATFLLAVVKFFSVTHLLN